MDNGYGLLVGVLLWVIGLFVLYLAIRFGVRDGMRDAQRRPGDGPRAPGSD